MSNTKRFVGMMTAQPHNRFVFSVVVVKFAANGNQALSLSVKSQLNVNSSGPKRFVSERKIFQDI